MATTPFHFDGRTALVTGASSGIGLCFAQALAAKRMHLVLTARSGGRLKALADELRHRHGVKVDVVVADLGRADGAREIFNEVQRRGITIDLLVNNAGFGHFTPLVDAPLPTCEQMLQVNCMAVVQLTRLFLPAMLERKAGGVINVASLAAFQPLPYVALYGATKTFVLSFTEALAVECESHGVRVMVLCPGNTRTGFETAAQADLSGVPSAAPEDVVRDGIAAFSKGKRGKHYHVHGRANYVFAQLPRFFPRQVVTRLTARVTRKHSRMVPQEAP